VPSGQGISTIDFGATPRRDASFVVTGQADIGAADSVEAFFQGSDSTADHPAETHKWILPTFVRPVADAVVAATGFTITLLSAIPLRGQVKVRWVWSS
jgi:hypothetical protein